MSTHTIYNRQNSIYLDEIRVTILVLLISLVERGTYLKILSWNFDLIEFLELEVAEPGTELLEVHLLRSLIEHLLEMIAPFTEILDVRFQCQFLSILGEDEVGFERGLQ